MLCASSGGEWTVLSEEVTESCFVVKDLPRGASYVFRMGCITKTGAGPFSDASAPVVMSTHPEGKKDTSLTGLVCSDLQQYMSAVKCTNSYYMKSCNVSPVFTLLYRDSHSSNPD